MCFLYTLNYNSVGNSGHTLAFVERYLAEQRTCRNKQHFFPVLFRKLLFFLFNLLKPCLSTLFFP